jgi:glucokinase
MLTQTRSLLVADVGGTKVVLALADSGDGFRELHHVRSYPSRKHESFDLVLKEYLTSTGIAPQCAVLAVAGPIANGQTKITNLPWSISERSIKTDFGIASVQLLNDLESTAWSVPRLADSDCLVLQRGDPVPEGTIAIIAPGTGLGEAILTWDGAAYRAHATEGGHTDFAPWDEDQDRLLAFLRPRFGHVSVERVCSGEGISNIYRYLEEEGGDPESPAVKAELAGAEDMTPSILRAALAGESPRCERAVRLFVDILAAEAGNLALKSLSTGGVVLAGGLPIRLTPFLQTSEFLSRFRSKGRFADWLGQMPISVLQDPFAPLRGAAAFAATDFRDSSNTTPKDAI